MSQTRSIEDINGKCRTKTAAVLTLEEIRRRLEAGEAPGSFDLDVAVAAFSCSMRGSAAMILVPVAGRGVFTRARRIWLDGVEAYPGPAPNERLGVVDALVFADQTVPEADGEAAGARLLLDILKGKRIDVECLSEEGQTYRNTFSLPDLEYARMVTYNTFLPSWLRLDALAPLGAGSTVLINLAPGLAIGHGTRHGAGKASLSLSADMLGMDLASLSGKDETTMSVVLPLPVTDDQVCAAVCAVATEAGQALDEDRETAERVKRILNEGTVPLTDSTLPFVGFPRRD